MIVLVAVTVALVAISTPWPADAQGVGSWTTRRELNTLRTEVGGAVIGGRLHVIGGGASA